LLESAAKVFEEQEEERRDGAALGALEDQETSEEEAANKDCLVEMYEGKRCGRSIHSAPAHDATPVCLMHSRDPEKKDEAFQEEFETILEAAGEGIADFTGFIFPNADYEGQEFAAACLFNNAVFVRVATFTSVTFARTAGFLGATFTREAKFNHATFGDYTVFSGATFTEGAGFIDATFVEDVRFTFATFSQLANFNDATFEKEVNFARASFLGAVEFRETAFEQPKKFSPGLIFSNAQCAQPGAVIFYKTNLGQALFLNCDVSAFTFSSVEWRQRKGSGKRMVFEEVVDLEDAKHLRPKKERGDERDYVLMAELYHQLKKNYDGRQDYWTGGDFHYGELEMKRLASKIKNPVLRWLVQHFRLVAVYKYASHYGESYVRPAIWLGVVLLLAALLFPKAGLRYDPAKDRAGAVTASSPVVLTYASPLFPGQPETERHRAEWRLLGNSCLTALEIAAFQKELAYQPVRAGGRLLTLAETLLTSSLAALFFLAMRRQFRR
jgi:uncharacterized protein YjbI with pentapeptide repeats